MKSVAIGPLVVEPEPKDLRVRLEGELGADLALYVEAYNQEYDQKIKENEMVAHILRVQIGKDKRFQAWKKKHANGSNGSVAIPHP